MKFEDVLKHISEEFTQAWNDGDLGKIVHFLTNDISVQSPNISRLYPENTNNIIVGKENVINYWKLLSETYGYFEVAQTSIQKRDNHVVTMNTIVGTGITIKETFKVNEYGKIKELIYEYSDAAYQLPMRGTSIITVEPLPILESK